MNDEELSGEDCYAQKSFLLYYKRELFTHLSIVTSAGDAMGKITRERKIGNYFKIFEQIFENPLLSIYDISQNTGLSRNTIAKYLNEMYDRGILRGPQLCMRPAVNYREYVYLLDFSDPQLCFRGLRNFPHVLYHALTFGDWNTMIVTDRPLDFSKLVGFQKTVYQGVRGSTYTSKAASTTWDEWLRGCHEQIAAFTPKEAEYKNRTQVSLPWDKDEWTLFHAFKSNLRQKVTPLLRKIKVRYETYSLWMKTLENYCTIHTGFYPQGHENYESHCFLFFTDYEESLKSLFSSFPVTVFLMEVGTQLLVFVKVTSSRVSRDLFCTLYDLKVREMIKAFQQSSVLSHSRAVLT